MSSPETNVSVELTALLIAVTDDEPRVLTVEDGAALPSGPFEQRHRSLQTGLRSWVERQTHHPLGYVEQLYTFADRDRVHGGEGGGRVVSIGYLGLTREIRFPRCRGFELAELVSLLPLGGPAQRGAGDPCTGAHAAIAAMGCGGS